MNTSDARRMTSFLNRSLGGPPPVLKGAEQILGDLCRADNGQYTACGLSAPVSGLNLERVGDKGGTVPGGRYKDKTNGREFIFKVYPQNAQAAVEAASNAIYRAAGIKVPPSTLLQHVKHEGALRTGVANEVLPDLVTTKGDSGREKYRANAGAIARGFGVDALLANWDVLGQEYDNVGFVKGSPVRLDAGGSMHFRAQGGSKNFPKNDVPELQTLLDPDKNRRTAEVYRKAFQEDPTLKIDSMMRAGNLSDEAIEKAVKAAGFDKVGGVMGEQQVIDTLKGRRDFIKAAAEAEQKEMQKAALPPLPKEELQAAYRSELKATRNKAEKAMAEFLNPDHKNSGALAGTDPKNWSFTNRQNVVQILTERTLTNKSVPFTVKTRDGAVYTTTPQDLAHKIMSSWTGSAHGREAQWFRQAATEYYGRSTVDEDLRGAKAHWLEKVPPQIRDVALSIKAASEQVFMKTFGLQSPEERRWVFRGVKDTQGKRLNRIAKALKPGGTLRVNLNVLSSFATEEKSASTFAGYGGVVIKDHVKAAYVWGYGGFGYSQEEEVVLARRTKRANITKEDVILKEIEEDPVDYAAQNLIVIVLPDQETLTDEDHHLPPGAPEFDLDCQSWGD